MSYVIRGITKKHDAIVYACDSKNIVQKAQNIHSCNPTALVALGRTLTAAALLGMTIKSENSSLTIHITGNGIAKSILAVANNQSNIKGYIANPKADKEIKSNGKFDVPGILGIGELRIIKDLGLKEPYIGIVPLVSGEIGDDLAYYFMNSEQIPSIIALGVLLESENVVRQAGGVIIQLLPEAKEEFIQKLENKMKSIKSITAFLEKNFTPEDILNYILSDIDEIEFLDKRNIDYVCDCNKDKFYRGLISLGKEELKSLFENNEVIETECRFCKNKYEFIKDDFNDFFLKF